MATTYVGLVTQTPGTTTLWATAIETNWASLDKYIGYQVADGVTPHETIIGDFVGQHLVELDASGDFKRIWICKHPDAGVAGDNIWITERQEQYLWENTQRGLIKTDVVNGTNYNIDLGESNFFRLSMTSASVTFDEPHYNGALLSAASPDFVIGTDTMSFQVELNTSAIDRVLLFNPTYWAFPYGGVAPLMSASANAIDFMFCTIRLDGKVHVGYNPLSV